MRKKSSPLNPAARRSASFQHSDQSRIGSSGSVASRCRSQLGMALSSEALSSSEDEDTW